LNGCSPAGSLVAPDGPRPTAWAVDKARAKPYPICMARSRRRAGLLLLALMLLGLGAAAGSALAAGGPCCAQMAAAPGAGDAETPCHSLVPTSCCERSAAGAVPRVPGAAALGVACTREAAAEDLPRPVGSTPTAGSPARLSLATVVLRL
jgi:hypothetical protein